MVKFLNFVYMLVKWVLLCSDDFLTDLMMLLEVAKICNIGSVTFSVTIKPERHSMSLLHHWSLISR